MEHLLTTVDPVPCWKQRTS